MTNNLVRTKVNSKLARDTIKSFGTGNRNYNSMIDLIITLGDFLRIPSLYLCNNHFSKSMRNLSPLFRNKHLLMRLSRLPKKQEKKVKTQSWHLLLLVRNCKKNIFEEEKLDQGEQAPPEHDNCLSHLLIYLILSSKRLLMHPSKTRVKRKLQMKMNTLNHQYYISVLVVSKKNF